MKESNQSGSLTQGSLSMDTKYKKALKQINKLISINTSIKKQLISVQQQYDSLRQNYGQLQDKYSILQQKIEQLTQKNRVLSQRINYHGHQAVNSQISIQADLKPNFQQPQIGSRQNYSPFSVPGKQLQNTGTISQFINTKNRLQQIQEKLNQKQRQINILNEQYASKQQQNAKIYQQYIQVTNDLNKLKNQNELRKVVSFSQNQSQKQVLSSQLNKQKQLISKLSMQNQILKKSLTNSKQIPISSENTSSTRRIQHMPTFNKNLTQSIQKIQRPLNVPFHQCYYPSSFNSIGSANSQSVQKSQKIDPFSQYYFKKVRDLQQLILREKKEFNEKKSKYKCQISKLKKQVQEKNENIRKITNFSIKQQNFIESYIIKNTAQQSKQKQKGKNVGQASYQKYQKLFNSSDMNKDRAKIYPRNVESYYNQNQNEERQICNLNSTQKSLQLRNLKEQNLYYFGNKSEQKQTRLAQQILYYRK